MYSEIFETRPGVSDVDFVDRADDETAGCGAGEEGGDDGATGVEAGDNCGAGVCAAAAVAVGGGTRIGGF